MLRFCAWTRRSLRLHPEVVDFCACFWVILVLALVPAATSAQVTALVGARVIDGRGQVIEQGAIVIGEGRILAVGPAATTTVPAGAERVDVTGATIIPGLINAHGHLTSAVGMRNDPAGYTRANLLRQLETYARYGVTTVFSLGDDQEAAFQLRSEQSSGPLHRARVFVAGPVINATTAEEARTMTDKVAAMKPDLLKIRIDDNLGNSQKMPEEAWRADIARAEALKLPVATHIFYLADAKAALMAGADIVAHSVRDMPVDAEFIRELKSRNACYIADADAGGVDVRLWVDTAVGERSVFPEGCRTRCAARNWPIPRGRRRCGPPAATSRGSATRRHWNVAQKNLKTMADAGVRVAMGTDTGPAGRWQGFFEHLELEMMVQSRLDAYAGVGGGDRCRRRMSWPGRADWRDSTGRGGRPRRAERESARRHPQYPIDQERVDLG